jgi:uncharacterized membrane protein HdeD (DUF308 family)
VTEAASSRTLEVRHVQLARAAVAAIAAIMVTFSPDHSAALGLSIFGGFAIVTAFVLLVAARMVYPAGRRWPFIVIGVVSAVAGLAGGIAQLRSTTMFFVILIVWAVVTGVIELIAGLRQRRALRMTQNPEAAPSDARDSIVIGAITIVFAIALALVPTQYSLDYRIEEADATFTLTGIIIGVGLFGAYTAIVAVYLAIAGFSPRKPLPVSVDAPGQRDETSADAPTGAAANDERGLA